MSRSPASTPIAPAPPWGHTPPLADLRLQRLFRAVAGAAAIAALAGCGGGGSGGAPAPSPPPAPAPQPIPAQMTVPAPVGYDAAHLAIFNRINELRLAAGAGMLAQSVALDRAAQAHVEWELVNQLTGHVETPGTEGFTGAYWFDRDAAQGYLVNSGSEVIATGCVPVDCVDLLFNILYHRNALQEFLPLDVGIGWEANSEDSSMGQMVADIAWPLDSSQRSEGQQAQSGISGVAIWPLDGAVNVSPLMGDEIPNPVPDVPVTQLGTPASVLVNEGQVIEVTEFEIQDSSGINVPAKLITAENDPNQLLDRSFVGLIPLQSLEPRSTYQVTFEGTIVGDQSTPIVKVWHFSTGSVD